MSKKNGSIILDWWSVCIEGECACVVGDPLDSASTECLKCSEIFLVPFCCSSLNALGL